MRPRFSSVSFPARIYGPSMITRRDALAMAVTGSTLAAAGSALAAPEAKAPANVAPGKHLVAPLPFDPKKLKGLSEKLLVSHHENNYAGALKNLNKVEEELLRTNKETPAFVVAGLRERELTFGNSVVLHELYFGNLGGNGRAAGAIEKAIADAFGGFARWEELFRATGMSLAGGSGWAVLDFSLATGDLRVHWSGGHTQGPANAIPLLLMDMYEHAFQMDYGAAAAKYVDAFFANINWDEVARRHERAGKAFRALYA
jgi:Fe-Mn family superoxide dismutase